MPPPGPFAGFRSRLGSDDFQRIEARTQQIGRDLLSHALRARPSPVSPDWWTTQAGEWATHDDDLKVRLFRLVDCMPMLDDPRALDRHVREYLDDDTLHRMPAVLRMALQAARSGLLAPLAARAVRAAMLAQARTFIAGTTPEEAAAAALAERKHRRGFTLDLLGEAVTGDVEADAYADAYLRLLTELPATASHWPPEPLVDEGPAGPLPRVNVSLKLSALDPRFDAIDPHGTTERVLARLRPLWRAARDHGAQVHVDMESHATKDLALSIFRTIAMEPEFREWPHCGVVVQCYLRDAPRDLADLAEWAGRRSPTAWRWPSTSASRAGTSRCRCSTAWRIRRSRRSRPRVGGCGSTCRTANSCPAWRTWCAGCSRTRPTSRSCGLDSCRARRRRCSSRRRSDRPATRAVRLPRRTRTTFATSHSPTFRSRRFDRPWRTRSPARRRRAATPLHSSPR
ncbi:MAG: hypothetical protein EBS51_02990 [Planctomycetia bacterium]|nr:hypothetical protein [Planctomycetia bacterium]